MTGTALLVAGLVLLVVVVFVRFLVAAVRSEAQERGWPAGSATVLDVRPWVHSASDAPHSSYRVLARLSTADGRQVQAWAEGAYAHADRWVGTTRPAWHHPGAAERFRLTEPRGALVGLLRLLPAVLVLLVVLAVFVGVAALALR